VALSLSVRSREADLFQRALEGSSRAAPAMGGYVEVAGRLSELVPTTILRPDPAYRAELHARLVELATARAATRPALPERSARPRRSEGSDRSERRRGLVLWPTDRLRRALAGGVAAVVALMLGVGVAAASALPGGLLYPVKELIQSTQVRLAHGDLSRGQVLLDQAGGHIADAQTLVSQGSPDPGDVDTALRQAGQDVRQGSQLLLDHYATTRDPAALDELARFTTAQSPLLSRLRDRVPVVSEPLVDQLLAQLGQNSQALTRLVAQCGAACSSVRLVNLPGPDGLPAATPGGLDAASSSSGSGGAGGTPSGGLGGALSGVLGGPGSGGLGSLGGAGSGAGGSGAGRSVGGSVGASVGSGGVGVTLPRGTVSVPAPSVGIGSGGASVGVPGASVTLGPVTATLPGVGVTLGPGKTSTTHPPATTASTPPTVCLLIVCLGG
jgi:hypothetical protein